MSENHPNYALDTDARSQAPTFDEMVAMIEKLFKDYLKDIRKNALTGEQIEEGWQRYKTLNHLYQDDQPKPSGAVWVKASIKLPPYPDDPGSHYRLHEKKVNGNFYQDSDGMMFFEVRGFTHEPYTIGWKSFQYLEWLDESGAGGNDAIKFAEWAGWEWRRVEGKSLWENQKTLEVIKTNALYERYKRECSASGKA